MGFGTGNVRGSTPQISKSRKMITTSRGTEGVTEESTVLRKSGAVPIVLSIDSAVVSSVRRDLFPDKSKCRTKVRSLAINHPLEFVPFATGEIPHSIHQLGRTSVSPESLHMRLKGVAHTSPRRGPSDENEVPQKGKSFPSRASPS
jgi:hypothetical protein